MVHEHYFLLVPSNWGGYYPIATQTNLKIKFALVEGAENLGEACAILCGGIIDVCRVETATKRRIRQWRAKQSSLK